MRISAYELSHLILRFEQEKDMKPMHCVQNLAALRDLIDTRIDLRLAIKALIECRVELGRFAGPNDNAANVAILNADSIIARLEPAC